MTVQTTLAAADAEDLEILSARLQDAVGKLQDFVWLPKQRRFAALVNRYRWEGAKNPSSKDNGTRVRAGLHFDGVLKVESRNIKHGAPDAVVDLLAISFTPNGDEDPGGVIELQLAGGGAFRLTVECIDAQLQDLTGPWAAIAKPVHDEEDQ
jgi:Protein of unknown function (DUF2948)